jgi:SAM-dependent methyltransferase
MLEIGPGYGQMTIELSKHCASVDAVEPDIKQARFCQIRATQEGRNNVRLFATGSSGELPFEGGIYGGVIMNLVLEWCGIREHGRDHQEIQQRYLNEIHRVLEPGGFLFISTKNRYALRLLLGGRDEHMSDMRFGSPLPRWLGKVLAGGVRQPGHIHSRSQLLRMLRAAGFDNIQGFVALPDMRWPKYYVPEGLPIGSDLLASLSPRLGKIAKLIPQGAFKYVSPGLTFLAIK